MLLPSADLHFPSLSLPPLPYPLRTKHTIRIKNKEMNRVEFFMLLPDILTSKSGVEKGIGIMKSDLIIVHGEKL